MSKRRSAKRRPVILMPGRHITGVMLDHGRRIPKSVVDASQDLGLEIHREPLQSPRRKANYEHIARFVERELMRRFAGSMAGTQMDVGRPSLTSEICERYYQLISLRILARNRTSK